MSIHFSKIIKAGDRNREFNFTRTNPLGNQYNVNVPDERGNRIFFTMQQEEGVWRTSVDILPQWVMSAEEELSKAIEEESKAVAKEGRK
ncbi:MAG TPA: hypothetical protein VM871_04715 [Flavisolibacter sp.]|nr:hypothetical protein [Flavisolibacter sp.]